METASIVASIVSVIVAVLAIGLSVYFYTQSKNTERNVATALASVQTQGDALQKLTGRWMDRLTRYATEQPKHDQETFLYLLTAIKEIPSSIATQFRSPASDANNQALLSEVVTAYLAIYYYVAVANVAMQTYLPSLNEIQPDDITKKLLDQTSADFQKMENIIIAIDKGLIAASPLHYLYQDAINEWRPFVKDATMVYSSREAQE